MRPKDEDDKIKKIGAETEGRIMQMHAHTAELKIDGKRAIR